MIDTTKTAWQQLDCGCKVRVKDNSPRWDRECPEAGYLFDALMASSSRNERQCAERDALRAHVGLEGE